MYCCGDVIDQYRLTKVLGSGSYGMVFEAENVVSGETCALKVIPLCGRAGARERKALRQYHNVEHPNLLRVRHSGISGDFLYYTMDLAEGTLAEQHLSPAQLRAAAVKLADALSSLHEQGLLHRDLKPDNLFFLNGEPLIGDIGLVTADCGASLTGTAGFIPSSVQKNGSALSEQSDLYALAKSFYCLLSGNPPGDYPNYAGTMDPDAAILLHGVLSICDDRGEITTAAAFRDFLRTNRLSPASRRRYRRLCLAALLLIAAGFGIWETCRRFSLSPGERMFASVRKAETYSSGEQAAIARQNRVYEQLKEKVRKQTEEQNPAPGKRVRLSDILKKHVSREDLLEKAVREQAEKSPEFHCFYVLRKDAEQASLVLYPLEKHPEYASLLEKEYQLWREKYASYCRERDSLRIR